MQSRRKGFTLVEMLVVIGIIGILIVALVPVVKGAQVRAKEAAIKAQCSNLEASLATFAQNNGGNYPGLALDVMAPWAAYGLGDPNVFAGGAGGNYGAAQNRTVTGVIGGEGHYNQSTVPVMQQMKTAKDTPLGGAPNSTQRHFDSLLVSDALQEYPRNPLVTNIQTNARAKMTNIFWVAFDMTTFDPNTAANGWMSADSYRVGLRAQRGGTVGSGGGSANADPQDTTRVFLENHTPLGLPLSNYTPQGFSDACSFGTGENDFFAPGDFAYVPILSSSPNPFGDTAVTMENEAYRWGTTVTGYLMFAYGDSANRAESFEDERRELATNGLPGYGGPGVDTRYEAAALQCFEGAIYFSKKI